MSKIIEMKEITHKDYLEFVLAYNNAEEFNINYVHTVYLHNFNQYNKKNGWSEGDELLKSFAKVLDNINKSDFVLEFRKETLSQNVSC